MLGVSLRFYFCDEPNQAGPLLYEWLLEHAKNIGMPGASAFRAIAGFGRHGQMRESHFGELSGSQPVLVEFLLTEEDAENLLKSLAKEPVAINYARTSVELGVVGARS